LRFARPVTGRESVFGGLIVSFCIAMYFRIIGKYARKFYWSSKNNNLVISGYNQIYRLRNYFTLIINLKLKKMARFTERNNTLN
jgi:hypothetical protein